MAIRLGGGRCDIEQGDEREAARAVGRRASYIRRVDRDAAIELVNGWYELPDQPDAPQSYQRMQRALLELLPDDITATGVATVQGTPTVLVLYPRNVFAVSVMPGQGESAAILVRRLHLEPTRFCDITLMDDRAATVPGHQAGGHVRSWHFRWRDGEELAFRSVVTVYGGWNDLPPSAERFAQALAGALDWQLPSDPNL